MKAGNVRIVILSNATAAGLMADVNKLFNGEAVGAFAAGFIKEKEFLDIQYQIDPAVAYTAMIVYTE